jgi:endonuclease YncB( thermonuclease family)
MIPVKPLAFIGALLLAPGPAVAQTIVGPALAIDGDSLSVGGREVRLQGVDAPEMAQSCKDANGRPWACGVAARDALAGLLARGPATCAIDPRDPADRYGRTLARCAAGGADLGEAMARAGLAVAYDRYLAYREGDLRPYAPALLAAEDEARAARRGIWRGRFDLPELWRRANPGRR